jgi:hypothetical protein
LGENVREREMGIGNSEERKGKGDRIKRIGKGVTEFGGKFAR